MVVSGDPSAAIVEYLSALGIASSTEIGRVKDRSNGPAVISLLSPKAYFRDDRREWPAKSK